MVVGNLGTEALKEHPGYRHQKMRLKCAAPRNWLSCAVLMMLIYWTLHFMHEYGVQLNARPPLDVVTR